MDTVDELDAGREHRIRYLLNLKVDAGVACAYADEVDPHDVERLIRHGCPPDLAIEIVR